MFEVLKSSWALLLGMGLLMVGNGLQGSLLGVVGTANEFSTFSLSIIMSGYFLGFLGGSRMAPGMIRRVGHVRVFAALASFISAVLILYPTMTNPVAWTIGRIIIGFCFSGVYVTAESWLNNASSNENRGKSLSLYLIVQMIGIVSAQGILNVADTGGYTLFVISSVLVSISFAPILLSISPTPAFETAKAMTVKELFQRSPLGCVSVAVLGGIFAAQFGMGAVYATQVGMSIGELSIFVSTLYIGAMVLQYPIGWISDRMDRRQLIGIVSGFGVIGTVIGYLAGGQFEILLVAAFIIGGMSNPLYGLAIAHTNDFLDPEDMAAASGGLVFANGLGAIAGPVVTGWAMQVFGPEGFYVYIGVLMTFLSGYAVYRMTQRPTVSVEDSGTWAPVLQSATAVAVEVAQEVFIEAQEEAAEEENTA
ncbi:MFS transporter [Halocynthiibacter namhaensis]|uniref:MFS transporter n=1 Tax=Halocynthiibacter namhaensis TaxID=1290553 RepID=UPI00057931A9|nr:MFS transporter [Halocynthiibacter namhaensis]